MDIGARLKMVREAQGISQRELAKRAGVTNASISLIEQNRVSPSVSSLKKVLDGLPMSMADFFTFELEQQPPRQVFAAAEQPDLGGNGVAMWLVGAGVENRQIGLLREVYAPGADTGTEMLKHEGQECGVVTQGCIELTIDTQVHILHPGDGYYFSSNQPHRFRNIGETEAILISANNPPTL
ncbi:transcriptional regulator, XRE family with cupin sensor [Formivibrio citricus]|uniref:Transcriptional regulator, XRE family with cupin sensor n=1 Tax=Formivibrio citricus TaxID=83765 RepID=A0A1I4WUV7_9NEIS|nr:cupin domain-containing protein [Formivibrio citricus]SFN17594.1 transcriptional regulator, XRE family with cupin sensor [Formivibrio citricus]